MKACRINHTSVKVRLGLKLFSILNITNEMMRTPSRMIAKDR